MWVLIVSEIWDANKCKWVLLKKSTKIIFSLYMLIFLIFLFFFWGSCECSLSPFSSLLNRLWRRWWYSVHFFSTAWGPRCTVWSIPFGAEEGIWKTPARAEKIRSAKSRRLCTWDFFLSFFFFLLLIVDSVGVQLLTATYKHCCRILLSLLQVLGLLCCNFRASVFVYPIIDLILVLNFQQVAIVGTDLADFLYMEP